MKSQSNEKTRKILVNEACNTRRHDCEWEDLVFLKFLVSFLGTKEFSIYCKETDNWSVISLPILSGYYLIIRFDW